MLNELIDKYKFELMCCDKVLTYKFLTANNHEDGNKVIIATAKRNLLQEVVKDLEKLKGIEEGY